ncbi:hypothetical protein G4B88_009431 [Cannabis sativa]|uniref:Uncharacterized protein n=1 Tax=Cannabis sativa TaxID=3483 RepID=A0A7J6GGP7_CANSA|nr:hypothetical protein G4B88_009431 [Cannabis sativa]
MDMEALSTGKLKRGQEASSPTSSPITTKDDGSFEDLRPWGFEARGGGKEGETERERERVPERGIRQEREKEGVGISGLGIVGGWNTIVTMSYAFGQFPLLLAVRKVDMRWSEYPLI